MNTTPGFIFGGNTPWSYEELQRKRGIAEQLQKQNSRTPQNAGEGLAAIGRALAARSLGKKADKREGELRSDFENEINGFFSGTNYGGPNANAGTSFGASAPVSPDQQIADDTMAVLGKPPQANSDWLRYSNQEATRNKPLNGKLVSALSFLPEMGITMDVVSGGQDASGQGNRRTGSTRHDHGNAADADFYMGDRKLDWNNENDIPILQDVVRRARANGVTGFGAGDDYMGAGRMHIGFGEESVWGAGGKGANAPEWLREAYSGAPASSFAPGPGTQVAQSGGGADMGGIEKIARMMGNPMASQGQKAVLGALLQQKMQAMQPQDPMEALQLQKMQLEIQQMQSGGGGQVPASVQEAQFRAREAGLQPGTPEYQDFMLNGGGDPATFRALDMQAQAAGFAPGSAEYAEFMATRGAGLQAGARTTGENLADIATGGEAARVVSSGAAQGSEEGKNTASGIAGAPSEIAQAEQGIALIDSIMTDPALPAITGMLQGRLPPMTQDGVNLNVKIKQLQGKAFLEAFESLKGGGAITEREGLAAQNAMARLDRAQSAKAYTDALNELKSIMQAGMDRAKARTATPQRAPFDPQTPDFSAMSDDELQAYIEGGGK